MSWRLCGQGACARMHRWQICSHGLWHGTLQYIRMMLTYCPMDAQSYRKSVVAAKRAEGKRSGLTEEQKQEIREAFDLFDTVSGAFLLHLMC